MSDSPPPDADEALRALADASDAAPDPVDLDAKAASSPHVDRDIGCLGCDYNLRGLPVEGTCPECGHSVAASLSASLIWRIDLRIVQRARWGARLIWLSMGLLMALMVMDGTFPVEGLWGAMANRSQYALGWVAGASLSMMVGVACVMMPVSTAPRRSILAHTTQLPRLAVMSAAVLTLSSILLMLFALAMRMQGEMQEAAVAMSIACACSLLSTLSALARLDLLAHLMQCPRLYRRTFVITLSAIALPVIAPITTSASWLMWTWMGLLIIWLNATATTCFQYDRRLSAVIRERTANHRGSQLKADPPATGR